MEPSLYTSQIFNGIFVGFIWHTAPMFPAVLSYFLFKTLVIHHNHQLCVFTNHSIYPPSLLMFCFNSSKDKNQNRCSMLTLYALTPLMLTHLQHCIFLRKLRGISYNNRLFFESRFSDYSKFHSVLGHKGTELHWQPIHFISVRTVGTEK